MKKIMRVIMLGVLIIGSVNTFNTNVDATPLDLDEKFQECMNVKYFSRSANTPITIGEFSTYGHYQISCENYGIKSIAGAEHLPTTVTYLNLSRNEIEDMSPIMHLTDLEFLSFSGNNVEGDISFVSGMTKLKDLRGTSNRISDITTGIDWSLFTEMEILEFGWNKQFVNGVDRDPENAGARSTRAFPIEAITPPSYSIDGSFSGEVSFPGITDITGLSGLKNAPNLTTVGLDMNSISDISELAELKTTNVRNLLLRFNGIEDITALGDLTTLRFVNLGTNNISDIMPIQNLVDLETLTLGSNEIEDISVVSNLVNLRNLSLEANKISDISTVNWSLLSNLDIVNIGYNHITDISPLNSIASNLSQWSSVFTNYVFAEQTVELPPITVHTSTYKISDSDLPVITDIDGSVIPYEASSNQLQTFANGETKTLSATWNHDTVIAGGSTVPFSRIVEQKVTYVFPLSIDADDFTIHIRDAVAIYDLLSKTLANARATDVITGADLFNIITVNGIELDKIKNTDVTGVFDLTFIVNHNGESAEKSIKVTVIDDNTSTTTPPNPVSPGGSGSELPNAGSSNYVSILVVSTFAMYILKRKVLK